MESMLRNSLFVGVFLLLYSKMEDLWLESCSLSLYQKIRQPSLRRSRILDRGLFSPLVVVLAFLLFMALSNYAVSPMTRFTIALGLLSFTIFALLPQKSKRIENTVAFDTGSIMAVGVVIFLTGLFFAFLSVAHVGGIPLLRPSLRYMLSPRLSIPSFLLIPALAILVSGFAEMVKNGQLEYERARFRAIVLTAACILPLAALGYRTPVIAVLMVVAVIGYYTRLFSVVEILGVSLLAFLLIVVVGYYRASAEYAWSFSPLALLSVRANFTMSIFDLLVELGGLTGVTHGGLLRSMAPASELGPRFIIASLISWRPGITITATLLGPLVVDFGTLGVFFGMSALGGVLGLGNRLLQGGHAVYTGIYALLISYAIIGVETGIIDLIVVGYFLLAACLYTLNLFKVKVRL
jgi:oligosaccharide repeat unit polymerase